MLFIRLSLRLGLAVLVDHLHEFVLERVQALARYGRDDKHGPAEFLFKVLFNELSEFLCLRYIGLVEDDDTRALAKVTKPGILLQQLLVLG